MRTVMLQPLNPTALVSIRSSLQQDRALSGNEEAKRIQHGRTMSHRKTRRGFQQAWGMELLSACPLSGKIDTYFMYWVFTICFVYV